ncbi:DNA repair and recombination protein RadB [Candidatus Woesearchaeota archaeon]|nr:DNA repair and recombination protein RadB [Candidatus Woesearchaeota archaeon]
MDFKIPSGSDIIDDFLEGGYEKDVLTTIYGPSGSGKTTLCMLASLNQARKKKKVIYIDSEGGFSIERFKQLAGEEFQDILKYIMLLKPTSFDGQNKALEKLKSLINEKIGLIVVDTLTIFYRLELAKKEEFKSTNNKLIWQISYLTEIARKHNIPILITNQVYSDFQQRNNVKMVGGDILKYHSKCLMKLTKINTKRKATLMIHRSIPEGKELDFGIINEGIIVE